MGNDTLKVAIGVEDDAVRARATPGIGLLAGQDGELIVRSRVRKAETLIVLVLVRVAVGGIARLEVAVPLLDGGVDIGLAVAGITAGVGALALLEERAGHG